MNQLFDLVDDLTMALAYAYADLEKIFLIQKSFVQLDGSGSEHSMRFSRQA